MALLKDIKWKLFGEWRILYFWFWVGTILQIGAVGIIVYVVLHFIRKYW